MLILLYRKESLTIPHSEGLIILQFIGNVNLVNFFRGKCQFGDNIGVGGIAVEGICFGGDIEAVFLPEPVEIILHVEAVHALGGTVDVVILAAIVAVDGEAVLKTVAHLGLAQGDKPIAPGEGINIHFIFVGIGAVQNLPAHLLLVAALQGSCDLGAEVIDHILHQGGQVIFRMVRAVVTLTEIAGKHQPPQLFHNIDDRVPIRAAQAVDPVDLPIQPVIRHGTPVSEYQLAEEELLPQAAKLSTDLQERGFHTVAVICRTQEEADKVRNSIKAEMEQREVEELIAGQYIVRWTSVLSNRFDSTAFKKVMPEIYKAYTKQVSSRRFTISV